MTWGVPHDFPETPNGFIGIRESPRNPHGAGSGTVWSGGTKFRLRGTKGLRDVPNSFGSKGLSENRASRNVTIHQDQKMFPSSFPHLNMVCFPSDFQIGQNIVLEFPTQNCEHQVFTLIPSTSRDVAINVLASLCSKGPGGVRPWYARGMPWTW